MMQGHVKCTFILQPQCNEEGGGVYYKDYCDIRRNKDQGDDVVLGLKLPSHAPSCTSPAEKQVQSFNLSSHAERRGGRAAP